MKKIVYISTALLAAAYTVLLTLEFIEIINKDYGSLIAFHEEIVTISSYSIITVTSLVFAALSLIQLKKSTPRLILLFSSYAFFSSVDFVFAEKWWIPFLYLIAGLLPAVFELIRHGRLVKISPLQQQRYDGMLIAAGVLSIICIAFHIYAFLSDVQLYKRFGSDILASYYYNFAVGSIRFVCTGLFCFFKYRRTGVFYRIFFIGSAAIGFLFFPFYIIDTMIRAANATYSYVDPLRIVGSMIPFALVFLILIQAFKTRHDSLISREHMDITPQAEIPVS